MTAAAAAAEGGRPTEHWIIVGDVCVGIGARKRRIHGLLLL